MVSNMQDSLRASAMCGEGATNTETTLRFDYGRVVVVFEGVPAVYCPELDETIVPGPVGVEIGDLAANIAEQAHEFLNQLESKSGSGSDRRLEIKERVREFMPI